MRARDRSGYREAQGCAQQIECIGVAGAYVTHHDELLHGLI